MPTHQVDLHPPLARTTEASMLPPTPTRPMMWVRACSSSRPSTTSSSLRPTCAPPLPGTEGMPTSEIGMAVYRLISSGGTNRTGRTQEGASTVEMARTKMSAVVADMWARSTTQERRSLWRRLQAWTTERGLGMNADSACLFVAATGVRPQGQLAYTKALSASFGAMGFENHPLRVLAKALRGGGAAIPENQATPIERRKLVSWARQQQASVRLAVLVAWKTASRWAEAASLSSVQFLLVTQREVVVDWFQTPKGRTQDPFKASRFAVIQGPLTAEIAVLYAKCAPFAPLSTVTTSALDALWGQSAQMQGYTAHSIKRGAVKHLLPLLTSGKLSPHLIDRLTKHEEEGGPGTLSRTTLRYAGGDVDLARALETGKVTKHL
ncbi:hypothetical protein DIPPA_19823 [Diplonema papillatum]|nr:hypothetical protein DIPPA_19823 [Diplonema papillatum]